jgi:two-component system, sensor histidine kinase and response regulator
MDGGRSTVEAQSTGETWMSKHLLLVDDEPRNLALLEAYLAPLGHEVTKAGGGREAVLAIERRPPDLILLDVLMPDLDGIDVLAHVRALSSSHIPVILVTGQTEREARLRGFEAGADEFLEKPVDRAMLLARVTTLLRLKDTSDELVRRNEALERLHREQRELTEFIVHDLKNPVTVVNLNLAWIRGRLTHNEDLQAALQSAQEGSALIQKMVEDLLLVAHLEQNDVPLRMEHVDVGELLDRIRRAHTCEADTRHVALSASVESGLTVRADSSLLRRVVENLLQNSLEYTPIHGRIALAAHHRSGVEIAVSNTGRAIPMEARERIFEKFRRGPAASHAPGHAGLGLYFCKRAMEAHGGSVTVAETPEWPTTFLLHLPAA